jgi:hypothetical protein
LSTLSYLETAYAFVLGFKFKSNFILFSLIEKD